MKMFTTIAVATAFLGLAACSEPAAESAAETAAPVENTTAETAAPAENTTVETDPAVVQSVDGESVQPK